jgi:hypothetical protein
MFSHAVLVTLLNKRCVSNSKKILILTYHRLNFVAKIFAELFFERGISFKEAHVVHLSKKYASFASDSVDLRQVTKGGSDRDI